LTALAGGTSIGIMRGLAPWIGLALGLLGPWACSGAGGDDAGTPDAAGEIDPGPDAGDDAAVAAGDESGPTDAGDVDDGLGQGLWVLVPDGAQACSSGAMSPDVFSVYQRRTRVDLRGGATRLPDAGETGALELLTVIEVGPSRARYLPRGPAEVFRESSTGSAPGQEIVRFTCYQALEAETGGEPLELLAHLEFTLQDGAPVAPLLVLDEAWLAAPYPQRLELQPWSLGLGSCTHASDTPANHRVLLSNGDRFELHTRSNGDPVLCMEHCPVELMGAAIEHGGERAEVTDFFRLAFADWQHNSFPQYLLVLDAPLGEVYGLHVGPEGNPRPAWAATLDASLAEIERLGVVEWLVDP